MMHAFANGRHHYENSLVTGEKKLNGLWVDASELDPKLDFVCPFCGGVYS